jgi:hypothetical protein
MGFFKEKYPLQNPTQGVIVAEGGGNVLGRQRGLWSTEAKEWGIVIAVSQPNPSGHQAAWGSAGGDCLSPWFLWAKWNIQGTKGNALAEFRSRRLGKCFYGTKRLWWDSVM